MSPVVLTARRAFSDTAVPRVQPVRRALTLALLLALGATANAATITVDSAIDGTPAGVCTLRSAVLAALINAPVGSCSAGSGTNTIVFAPNVSNIDLINGELRIEGTTALTLDGGNRNVVVRRAAGAAAFRIINVVPNVELTLKRITISGGLTQSGNAPGAGINANGPLTLINSTISGNSSTATGSPGAGINAVGPVMLIDSVVSGNSTLSSTSGGAGINTGGVVTLTDSIVSGNTTTGQGSGGGGINSYSGVNMLRSSVLYNATHGYGSDGGGIRSGGAVTMARSLVTGNLTVGDSSSGGGIDASGAVSMSTSTLSNNTVRGRFDFEVGRYHPAGGGIRANNVVLTNSTISGNRAEGVDADGGGIFTKYDVQMTNSTVSGNAAAGNGGGIWAHTITMMNSTVSSNSTRKYGECGGLFLFEDPGLPSGNNALVMRSSILFGNSSQTLGNVCLSSRDATGLTITGSHNLIGPTTGPIIRPVGTLNCDPSLSVLGDYGGPTQTRRLNPQSCAINAGTNAAGSEFDQRGSGFPRLAGPAVDIGAFEFNDLIFRNGFDQ